MKRPFHFLVRLAFPVWLLVLFAGLAHAQAAVVNIDVGQDFGQAQYSGLGALDDPGTFWNEITTSGTNLLRSDGVTPATGMEVNLTGAFAFKAGNVGNELLRDYQVVSVFNSTYIGDIDITGLTPSTNYLIYVYSAGNGDGQAGIIELQGDTSVEAVLGATSAIFPDTFAGDETDFVEGRNYVALEVVSSSAGEITGTYRSFANDAGINGLQIKELAAPLPARITKITGAESPTVHSAGDTIALDIAFNKAVTLSQPGGAAIQLDYDGTPLTAQHVGDLSGASLRFETVAPANVTTLDAFVVADSFQLTGGATLTGAGPTPAELDHASFALPNDQVSATRLSLYSDQIPDPATGGNLDPSPYFSFRVREVGGTWESPFAWVTKSIDDDVEGVTQVDNGSYRDLVGGWSHTYTNFEMANNVEVEIEITQLDPNAPGGPVPIDIQRATPHPRRKVKSWRVENGRAYVVIDRPALFAVDVDGRFDDDPALLGQVNASAAHAVSVFANPFILDKPDPTPGAPGVRLVQPGELPPYSGTWSTLYFLPGVHHLFAEPWSDPDADGPGDGDDFDLESGKSYYIPGDAIVHGNMTNEDDAGGGENIRIFGHGTLSGEKIPHHKELGIVNPDNTYHTNKPIYITGDAKGTRIEGVTVTDSANHSVGVLSSWKVDPSQHNFIRWTKLMTWRQNSDGISPNGSSVLEDCFLRTQDDGTYIGGMAIRRNVYWSDVNGMALRGSNMLNDNPSPYRVFGDLLVEDIDVLYAREFFAQFRPLEERTGNSVIGFPDPAVAFQDNDGSHIVYRDIHVHDLLPTRTLFGWDLGSGTTALADRTSVADVRFDNIRAAAPNLDGEKDPFVAIPEATISGLIFNDVTLAGAHYDDFIEFNDPSFDPALIDFRITNEFVTGFLFEDVTPEPMTFLNGSGLGKWYLKDNWDSGVEPADNDIVNHTAGAGDLIVDGPVFAGTLNVAHASNAVVSIENGGQLRVTDLLSVGASSTGEMRLIDGGLTLLNDQSAGLLVGTAGLHFEKGTFAWAGDHVTDLQALVSAGAITFANGFETAPFPGGTSLGEVGGTELFAAFDSPTTGFTTAWAVPEPSATASLAVGVLGLFAGVRRRRAAASSQLDRHAA